MKSGSKGAALVILSAVIFGFTPVFAKTVYECGSNSFTLAFHRFLFGSVALLVMHLAFEKGGLAITRSQAIKLFICSLGNGLTPVFLLASYNYLSSGMATTIHFVYPVLVLIGCVAFCHEKLTARKALCCALCMGGILCFYTPGGGVSVLGILISFISGVTYAFYIIYLSHSGLQELPPYKLGFYLSLFAGIQVLVISLLSGNLTFAISAKGWLLTILLAILLCFVATTAFQVGAKYVGPQNASLLSTFEPLTSVVVGILVYKEALTLRSGVGIVLILLAVMLLTGVRKKSEARA